MFRSERNPYIDPVSSATSNFFASNDQGLIPGQPRLNPTPAPIAMASNCTLGCLGRRPFNFTAPSGPFGPNLVAVAGRNPQPNVSQYAVNADNFSATAYHQQKYGYVEQWNFGIQRELPGGFFADVAYAGSHGVHLEQFNTNVNQIPDSFITQAASNSAPAGQPVAIAQKLPARNLCAVLPLQPDLPGSLAARQVSPTVSSTVLSRSTRGLNFNGFGCCGSTYNSLQATVTKRFQGGGTLLVAYTNAKLMSNTDTLTSWLEGGTTGGVGGSPGLEQSGRRAFALVAGCFATLGHQLRA